MSPGDRLCVRFPGSRLPWDVEVVDVYGDQVSLQRLALREPPELIAVHELELVADPFPAKPAPRRAAHAPPPSVRAEKVNTAIAK